MEQLPCSLIAEQAVLGAILLKPTVITQVKSIIEPSDFHFTENRIIYNSLLKLNELHESIDMVSLKNRLILEGDFDKTSPTYLLQLLDATPTSENVEKHCDILIEKSCRRSLIKWGKEIQIDYNEWDLGESTSKLIKLTSQISERRTRGNIKTAAEVANDLWSEYELIQEGKKKFDGIATEIPEIDNAFGYMSPGDIIVIAARPGDGKTAMGVQIATNVSMQSPVLLISAEMPTKQIVMRMLSSGLNVVKDLKNGRVNDWRELAKQVAIVSKTRLYIDDRGRTHPAIIHAVSERIKQNVGLGLVVVDYVQIIHPDAGRNRGESRYAQIGEIMMSLKSTAKSLDIPIVVLAQLSRNAENQRRAPVMSDLKESGNIEENMDKGHFIWHPAKSGLKQDENNISTVGMAKIITVKNRNAETGTINLTFDGAHTRFLPFREQSAFQIQQQTEQEEFWNREE